MNRFVVGDTHGGHKALIQVLEQSKFDYTNDQLICLGDVADGWPEVPECFDELLKMKNLIYVIGNHDDWLLNWFHTGQRPPIWTSQGGQATIDAYKERYDGLVKSHQILLENAMSYCVTNDNKLFVHGGFNWKFPIENQARYDLMWDRHLYAAAAYWENQNKITGQDLKVNRYNEVFIGHTSTCYYYDDMKPVHLTNVWNLDQGGGWEGKLTLMNIDTKEYFQSDLVFTLYPNVKGRR